MVLIWGMRKGIKASNPRQANLADMQRRARILMDILQVEKKTIIVPTVMVAELLTGIPPESHGDFLAELQKRFFCPPFDLPASSLAARLWNKHKALPRGQQLERPVLKADVMIIAAAKTAGAGLFYSHDAKCRKLATMAGMMAEDLPERHPDMHVDAEYRQDS
jgi:hypothetical protein